MTLEKFKHIALKVIVTFVEAGAAYWATTGHLVSKTALAGVIGAGISAVYNLARHYTGV